MTDSNLEVLLKNGIAYKVYFGSCIVGQLWGIETADRGSFFTLTEDGKGFVIIEDDILAKGISYSKRKLHVRMAEGLWELEIESFVRTNNIFFRSCLLALEDSYFQDFVHRYQFEGTVFKEAVIAEKIFQHSSTNRWYQFPVNSVKLFGEEVVVTIQTTHYYSQGKFRGEMYVRDEHSGRWIVHARLMPHPPEEFWIRWDTRAGRLVDLRGRWARWLLNFKPLRSWLWYRAERLGGHPNFQGQGLARLRSGEKIVLETKAFFSYRSHGSVHDTK